MSQPDVRVDPEALRGHAQMVDQVSDMVDEATTAAGYLNMHDEVYGEWPGRLIVPLLNIAQDHASQELRRGTDAAMHVADLLRSVASGFNLTDGEAAALFRAAGS